MPDDHSSPTDTPCHHVEFQGRVQGVGFRLTTTQIAQRFPVSGYVKNMPNGTVWMVVRCDPSTLDEFLNAIESAFSGHIDNKEVREATSNECFDVETHGGFEIRY